MLQQLIINIWLTIYYYYSLFWRIFFSYIGSFIFIYHIKEKKMRNITFNYYFKYGLDKFKNGTFYAKIYNAEGTSHIAFNGEIDHIHKINIQPDITRPKRKKIILLNNENPLNVDLQILDSYKINMKHLGDSCITNLAEITKMLNLECTHVTIIEMFPFKKITMEIDNVDINYMYL